MARVEIDAPSSDVVVMILLLSGLLVIITYDCEKFYFYTSIKKRRNMYHTNKETLGKSFHG